MLLEVLRLAASDGDVSAWGRTQEEEGETDSQHLQAQFPARDLIFGELGSCSQAVWQRAVRDVREEWWCSERPKSLQPERAQAAAVPG